MIEEKHGFCPECEIRKIQAELTPERIQELADSQTYAAGISVDQAVYEGRLSVCAKCSSLQGGVLCKECGSYVAFRAKLKAITCPYPGENKWGNI